jgi:hypothetical protein
MFRSGPLPGSSPGPTPLCLTRKPLTVVSVTATEYRGISKDGMPGVTPVAAPGGSAEGSGVPHWYSTYERSKRLTVTICVGEWVRRDVWGRH